MFFIRIRTRFFKASCRQHRDARRRGRAQAREFSARQTLRQNQGKGGLGLEGVCVARRDGGRMILKEEVLGELEDKAMKDKRERGGV